MDRQFFHLSRRHKNGICGHFYHDRVKRNLKRKRIVKDYRNGSLSRFGWRKRKYIVMLYRKF